MIPSRLPDKDFISDDDVRALYDGPLSRRPSLLRHFADIVEVQARDGALVLTVENMRGRVTRWGGTATFENGNVINAIDLTKDLLYPELVADCTLWHLAHEEDLALLTVNRSHDKGFSTTEVFAIRCTAVRIRLRPRLLGWAGLRV